MALSTELSVMPPHIINHLMISCRFPLKQVRFGAASCYHDVHAAICHPCLCLCSDQLGFKPTHTPPLFSSCGDLCGWIQVRINDLQEHAARLPVKQRSPAEAQKGQPSQCLLPWRCCAVTFHAPLFPSPSVWFTFLFSSRRSRSGFRSPSGSLCVSSSACLCLLIPGYWAGGGKHSSPPARSLMSI